MIFSESRYTLFRIMLLARLRVEELEDLARAFGADAGDLAEIGDRGALDLLQRSERHEQCALARRADAGDLLQACLADVLLAQLAVRPDHEAMRLIAQPLDEVEHGIARLELDRLAIRHEQGFASRVALRALGDCHQRNLRQAKRGENLAHRVELAAAAV